MYGAPPPAYYPPPAPAAGPTVISVGGGGDSGSGSPCASCTRDTGNMPRKKVGCVAIIWCVTLFFLGGGLCSLIPLCTDSCKDTEMVCVRCQMVKSKMEANCCWNDPIDEISYILANDTGFFGCINNIFEIYFWMMMGVISVQIVRYAVYTSYSLSSQRKYFQI